MKRHWLTTKTKRDNCGQTMKKKETLVDKQ